MDISANFRVETIENGFVVTHHETKRSVYVHYRLDVARQVERFMHDEMVERMENAEALEAAHAAVAASLAEDRVVMTMQEAEG